MTLRNCHDCGKPVRLGAMRVRVNGKQGVAHYIAHADGSPMHSREWLCSMMKPYPKRDEDKAWWQMCNQWNASCANAEETAPPK